MARTIRNTINARIRKLTHGDEVAVGEDWHAGLLQIGKGVRHTRRCLCELDEQVREIQLAHDAADQRHDQIIDKRIDDFAERRTDDHAHCQVDHVAAHREFLEVLHQCHRFSPDCLIRDKRSS